METDRLRPRSVQDELPVHLAPFIRRDQLLVRVADRVQRPVELGLPEFDEPDQNRKLRRQVVILPDEALQQVRMIGKMIENSWPWSGHSL